MKKIYQTPLLEVCKALASNIICASVGFGDDSTDTMHAKEDDLFGNFEEDDNSAE